MNAGFLLGLRDSVTRFSTILCSKIAELVQIYFRNLNNIAIITNFQCGGAGAGENTLTLASGKTNFS